VYDYVEQVLALIIINANQLIQGVVQNFLKFRITCGADRYFYNQTIDMFNKQQIKTNFINYRNVIVRSKKI